MSNSKRARGNGGSDVRMPGLYTVGVARPMDVDERVITPVLEEIRRMCVFGLSIQRMGTPVYISVADIVEWSKKGHISTPDTLLEVCGRTLLWTGLEDCDMILGRADLHVMAQTVSALMRGCNFSGDVDLSINRSEARLMNGRKKIGSILAFMRGDCNMKLSRVVTCDDGSKVDEISFALLPADEKEFFLSIKVPFFCFHKLCVDTEKQIVQANWDGFGDAP